MWCGGVGWLLLWPISIYIWRSTAESNDVYNHTTYVYIERRGREKATIQTKGRGVTEREKRKAREVAGK